ncbi:CG0192-related protein [Nocardioides speluncae]|uniref:CG0192-related protein n=1 Tax=Nocardioides speluncae TaxID=2670337 RepID=UPI000D69B79F|nr:hypothetical protein [Nocardioides speluncae]
MAIVHKATLTPTKLELVATWLEGQPWAGAGELVGLGSYRFDDPDGEVGVEGLLVGRDDVVLHVPMTYRGAPLAGAEAHLLGTMQHSALGERWVYDATSDPVAVGCFLRALRGEQQQAAIEIWDGDVLVGHRDPDTTVRSEAGGATTVPAEAVVVEVDGSRLTIGRVVGSGLDGPLRLTAEWAGGAGVLAAAELG